MKNLTLVSFMRSFYFIRFLLFCFRFGRTDCNKHLIATVYFNKLVFFCRHYLKISLPCFNGYFDVARKPFHSSESYSEVRHKFYERIES